MKKYLFAAASAATLTCFVAVLSVRFPCCGTEPDIYPRSMRLPKPEVSWMSREAICCARKNRDKRCSYEYC